LEEVGFFHFFEFVPVDMRGYVGVDVAQIARYRSCDYELVERPGSGCGYLIRDGGEYAKHVGSAARQRGGLLEA
jgi:hypothetical protein